MALSTVLVVLVVLAVLVVLVVRGGPVRGTMRKVRSTVPPKCSPRTSSAPSGRLRESFVVVCAGTEYSPRREKSENSVLPLHQRHGHYMSCISLK